MKRVGELYEVVVFTASVSKVSLIFQFWPVQMMRLIVSIVWRPTP